MIMIPAPGINGSDRTCEGVCQALIPTVHRKSTVTMFSPSSGQSHRDASATHGGATRRRGHGRRPAAQSTNQRFQSPQEGQSEGCREGLTGHRCCETVRHAVQRHGDHNQVPTRNCPAVRPSQRLQSIHGRQAHHGDPSGQTTCPKSTANPERSSGGGVFFSLSPSTFLLVVAGFSARWIREPERLGYIGAERCNRPRTSAIWLRSPRIPIISHGRYELTESAHGKGKTGRARLSGSGTRYTAPMVSAV